MQGITIADPNLPDCPLMYVNEAFCRMTGYAREEIIGRNCRFLQGPDTDPASVVRIRKALEQVCSSIPQLTCYCYHYMTCGACRKARYVRRCIWIAAPDMVAGGPCGGTCIDAPIETLSELFAA